jgi:hypothetical protein
MTEGYPREPHPGPGPDRHSGDIGRSAARIDPFVTHSLTGMRCTLAGRVGSLARFGGALAELNAPRLVVAGHRPPFHRHGDPFVMSRCGFAPPDHLALPRDGAALVMRMCVPHDGSIRPSAPATTNRRY